MPTNPSENPKIIYSPDEVVTSLMSAFGAGRVGSQFIRVLQAAFKINAPQELLSTLKILNVKIEGGDGTSQDEAVAITGDIMAHHGQIIEHLVVQHLRPGAQFEKKDLVATPETTHDVFYFSQAPELWIDITEWWQRSAVNAH